MTAPAQTSTPIDMNAVVEELIKDPHGRALWERAQFLVLARGQQEELEYLRSLNPPAMPSGVAESTPPGGS